MAHLGHMYANGLGVKASNSTAIKWFRKGSDRGNPSAQFGLGYMYLRGVGLPQDYRMAVKFLTSAAEQVARQTKACALRVVLTIGMGLQMKGPGPRRVWVTVHTDLGLTHVQFPCPSQTGSWDSEMMIKRNGRHALHVQGHPEAWFHLGTVHLNGWGVPISMQQAQAFFAMAAKAGHVMGQYNLAMIYLKNRCCRPLDIRACLVHRQALVCLLVTRKQQACACLAGNSTMGSSTSMRSCRGRQHCEMALERLKDVAEKGPWSVMLQDASDAVRSPLALLVFLIP